MAWKIYSIGKANAEIQRLENELAAAKAAPQENETKISELAASNELLATELANTRQKLDASEKVITDLTAKLDEAQKLATTSGADATGINTQLTATLANLHIEVPANATPETKFKAIESAVTTTLNKLGVNPQVLPAAAPANPDGDSLTAQLAQITDPKARTEFYRKHKAAIDAAFTAKNHNHK